MDEAYGREEWREDEGGAEDEARRRIAEAARTGAEVLDFSDLTALTTLPAELADLTGLRRLFAGDFRADGRETPFYGRRLTDISALAALTGLTTLDLSRTPVLDIRTLAALTGLTTLDLSYTEVSEIGALAALTGLTTLHLSGTQVSEISILLQFPAFAEEGAEYLSFQGTPAADPEKDRRLYMLSRLDPQRSAIETVQYLKGTHPDFRDPPGGRATQPLAERLAEASPVSFDVAQGQLAATNPGTPERVAPKELTLRIQALRAHLAILQTEAAAKQVPEGVKARLTAYAAPLQMDEPTYILLDGPMSFLRGAVADPFVTDGLEKGFVEGWRQLVTMHDDLRPLLLPPEEEDDLPPLAPEATPEEGIKLADAAIEVAEEAEGPGGTDQNVAAALRAIREYFEVAKANGKLRPGMVRRGLRALGGTLAHITYLGAAGTAVSQWLATPQGQAFLAKLQPILEIILKFFPL